MLLAPREVRPSSIVARSMLTVRKIDKLITSQLGLLAQRRLARGVKLNHAEATVQPTRTPEA